MARSFRDRTVVISGAAKTSGLGHAFCKGFVTEGANVVIADLDDATAAVQALQELNGGKVAAFTCDVSKEVEVERLKEFTLSSFGGCDILIHGASPFPSHYLDEMDFAEWRLVVSVNLDGLFLLTKAFLPGMKQRRWGRIIPISSTTYQAGIGGRTHYVASKAGMIGFTRSLAREVGDFGITVNVLAPGLVRTAGAMASHVEDAVFAGRDPYEIQREQQCIRQTLVPENLVGTVMFLASDDSAYMTGQTLLVDAGWQHVG